MPVRAERRPETAAFAVRVRRARLAVQARTAALAVRALEGFILQREHYFRFLFPASPATVVLTGFLPAGATSTGVSSSSGS